MRKVEQGDFKQKINSEAGGEIESLTDTFNRMVEKIQNLITEVYENEIKSQ
jgi:two-component system sensor histidine kinase YesM